MQSKLEIYEGFADGLAELNGQVVSDKMKLTPAGRAYKMGEKAVYAADIHICTVGEDEGWHLELLRKFKSGPETVGGRVYMGAAGLLNFGFIAATRPAAVILFDINAAQTVFWNDAIRALAENPDIGGFLSFLKKEEKKLPGKLREIFNEASGCAASNPECLETNTVYRMTAAMFTGLFPKTRNSGLGFWLRKGRWQEFADRLWIREGYKHLHLLAKHRAIGAITLDMTDVAACAQLDTYLAQVKYRAIKTPEDSGEKKQSRFLADKNF